jgi:hypothetical protein
MSWQARLSWGACTALATAMAAGCGMVPLDGLTGNDPEAGVSAPDGPDAGAPYDAAAPLESSSEGTSDGAAHETGQPGLDGASGPESAADTGAAVDAPIDPGDATSTNDVQAPPPIGFVQIAVSTASSMAGSATVKLGQAQLAGDLNVVAIGWDDATGTIASVDDSSGNTYVLAVGPTRYGSDLSQAIYYAKNIAAAAAGANSVKVTFVQSANAPDLRVLEYSGLDTAAPLDQVASATGKGTGAVSTPAVNTAVARELLFGAGMTTDVYSNPGSGYTLRVITNNGDLAEDRIVSAAGSYPGNAALGTVTAEWVFQLATFR